jgi:hypothetical protein
MRADGEVHGATACLILGAPRSEVFSLAACLPNWPLGGFKACNQLGANPSTASLLTSLHARCTHTQTAFELLPCWSIMGDAMQCAQLVSQLWGAAATG